MKGRVQRLGARAPGKSVARLSCHLCVWALFSLASLQAQTLERAESLWKLHNYDAANDAFRDLVKKYPKNADYRIRWGRLFLERFNTAEACDCWMKRVISLAPIEKLCQLMIELGLLVICSRLPFWRTETWPLTTVGAVGFASAVLAAKQDATARETSLGRN